MENFTFITPTYFDFGRGTEAHVGSLARRFGASRLLLVYGGHSAEATGLLGRVRQALAAEALTVVELGGVKANPRDDLVYRGIELARQEKIDFILAVGGGSVIDTAKAIAFGVPYDGDFWEVFEKSLSIHSALPVATVLTLPATGSEASDATVITQVSSGKKYGYGSMLLSPVFSIMDPELCFTLPVNQRAAGVADMMAHILERYLSNTPEVGLTDELCEATLRAIIHYAPRIMEKADDYEAWANIMWAGTVAHNDTLGIGRQQDWSSHAIEHELSARYDVAHGAGLAVVFPAYMTYTLQHDVARYARLAQRVFHIEADFAHPEETAARGIYAFRAFFHSLGLPTTLAELGVPEADIPSLAHSTRRRADGHTGWFVPLTEEDIVKIYQLMK